MPALPEHVTDQRVNHTHFSPTTRLDLTRLNPHLQHNTQPSPITVTCIYSEIDLAAVAVHSIALWTSACAPTELAPRADSASALVDHEDGLS